MTNKIDIYKVFRANFGSYSWLHNTLGLYHSAISVAHDTNLRHEIKRSTLRESRFLDSIGTAQKQQEVEAKVMRLTKDKAGIITQESGIEPSASMQN